MSHYLNLLADLGILAILAMSLNVICGLTGVLQLGHAGFFAVGAYTAGLVSLYGVLPWLGPADFLVGAVAAMGMAGLVAVLLGLPCLRLRGDYLAIATLAFGEIVRLTLQNLYFPAPGGGEGRIGGATGIALAETATPCSWWFIWLCAAFTFGVLVNVRRSAIGRAFQAIREDEVAARAMGVNLPYYKTLALVLAAVFAGLAGALYAHKQLYLAPNDYGLLRTIEVLLIVVLGGLGSFSGSVLAAGLLMLLRERLSGPHLGLHRELIFAVLLVVLVRFVPHGLCGQHELPELLRRARRAWARRTGGAT